jgi:uncharacterized protein
VQLSPAYPVCAALLALCSCAALVPQDETRGEVESGDEASTAAPTGAAEPDLPEPDPADLVLATYNVRRFFDATCDSGQCGSGDYEEIPSQGQFEYHADTLAEAITGLDADIVLLEEVENQRCIDALTSRLDGAFPTAILGETGFPASVDVAVLSRFPSLEVRRHADVPLPRPSGGQTWFSREFLEVHLDAGGHRVIVFVAHFKAKADDDPERRLAEATRAREIIDAVALQHPEALIVMGGDLNDEPGSPPLVALEGEGGMLRVAAELAPDDWTYRYNNKNQSIDHIYQATAGDGGRYITGSAHVFRGDGGGGYGGSDHAALRASFRAE